MQRELQDDERKAFEAYLLAGNDQNLIQKALEHLVPGSKPHQYLYFVNLLTKGGGIKTEQDQQAFENFTNGSSSKSSQEAQQLKLWNLLQSFDSVQTSSDDAKVKEVKSGKILDELTKDYLKFTFNHQKPELKAGIKGDESSQEEDETKNTLKVDFFDFSNKNIIEKKIAKMKIKLEQMEKTHGTNDKMRRTQSFKIISDCLTKLSQRGDGIWQELDFTQFDAEGVFGAVYQNAEIAQIQNDSLFSQLVKGILSIKDESTAFNFEQIYKRMTLQQLDKLKKLDNWFQTEDNFIGAYFQKQFCEELSSENQEIWTISEKLENLERLYGLAKSQGHPKAFQRQFLEEILALGPKNGTYSKEYFRDYINTLEKYENELFEDFEKAYEDHYQKQAKETKRVTDWNQYCSNVRQNNLSKGPSEIILEYLDYFCEQSNGSLAEYYKDFKKPTLNEIEKKWKVWLSRNGLNSLDQDQIGLDFYKRMADEVQLQFSQQNKELFLIEENVSLEVTVKNIKLLHVKVFEFNTETYYKKNLQPFNTSVNLDGLEASESNLYTYEHANNIRHRETFTFPQLQNRVGLFIVEFMGNGVSARAVIKKGSLSLIHRSTIAGHLAYVLDANKNVCKGDKTGVWFDNKYYQADKDTGRIFIPYSKEELSQKMIMIHGDFAQLSEFVRKQERYQFAAQFYLHSGSVLVGSSTSVIVKAQLNVNGRKAKLDLLKNVKIVLTTFNYIDNLPVTKTFSNLSFDNDKELSIQFQVPPNLRSIDLALTCEILNATTKQLNKFNASKKFDIVSNITVGDQAMSMPYLKKVNGQYEVTFLGRNGEPAAKTKINLHFKHRLQGKKPLTHTLITDKQGKIKLGSLTDVSSLIAKVSNNQTEGTWNLQHSNSNGSSYWSYPQTQIELLEGDSIELPICLRENQTKLDRKWLSLIHSNNSLLIDDWFDHVELNFTGDSNFGYHSISINNLQQGTYALKFVSGHETLQFHINVHKGSPWQGADSFILKKNCLQENIQSTSIVKISNVEIKTENQKQTVQVTVENGSNGVHLHAFAHQFLPADPLELFKQFRQLQLQDMTTSTFPFAKWQNIFQSNRQMADEIRYVFDRKQLEGQLGNTLDRPSLLNKRNFVQKTQTDAEILSSGANYADVAAEQYNAYAQNVQSQSIGNYGHHQLQNVQQQMIGGFANEYQRGGHRNNASHDLFGYSQSHHIPQSFNAINIHSEFQNFIKTSPFQKFNITPQSSEDENRNFSFTCDLSEFSQLVLIVIDKDSITQRTVDLDIHPISKRDLRQLQVVNQDQGLTESRFTAKNLKGEQHFIEDISSTDVQLVDDLTKVHEILSEIRKVQNVSSHEFQAFDFVLKWHSLTTEQKDRYYSDFCCHELNFFIAKKDETYFRQTVKPFLQSKMEKQFMDFYLLGQTQQVVGYVELHMIKQLNVLEQCLLIDVLKKQGQQDLALALSTKLQLQQNSNSKQDQDSVNYSDKIFDLVLNLNSLSQNQGALQNMKKESLIKQELEKKSNEMSQRMSIESASVQLSSLPQSNSRYMSVMPQAKMMMRQQEQPKMMMKSAMRSASLFDEQEDDAYAYEQRTAIVKKQNFEELESTSEFMETHYYKQTVNQNSKNLVTLNQFWCDYAAHLASGETNFLSKAFTDCVKTDRESFFAICVLNLPMNAETPHEFKPNEGRGVLITAASNLLLFKKEIKSCAVDLSRNDIMVIHRYSELNQASSNSNSQKSGKPDEFLARTPYTCEVVITNVAPKAQSFNLLYQVPEGAVPLKLTKYMKSQFVSLMPYRSLKVQFHFYFPVSGKFKHFPSNISVNGVVQARGGANELVIVDSKRISKIESFEDILHAGSKQDVLNFLKTENLFSNKKQFNFYSMLYLLKDKQFFDEVVNILKDRLIFQPEVWQYAFYHKSDTTLMRECLMISKPHQLIQNLGSYFQSNLIEVDENSNGTRYLEYHPMVNSRTHLVGQSHKIMNQTFRKTYDKFLSTYVQKASLTNEDKLIYVYYLQLQDRIQEAIDLFNQIQAPSDSDPTLKIQYDYLQAYFDFFSGTSDGYKVARRIVQKYDNYPVASWRMMFLTIADQLNEFDGEFDNEDEMIEVDAGVQGIDAQIREKRAQNKKDAKKREPQLNVEVDAKGTLKVESVNIKELSVKYYIINAELLFSRQPFLKDNTEGFSYVKAYHTLEHQMHQPNVTEEQLNQYVKAELPIPDKLVNQNMVIEITSLDLQKFLTYYSNDLKVNVLEQYGELKVSHATSGVALPRTYVKVFYQKKSGGEMFYRDGYTDIRGKIEYAQTSGDKLKDVKKFAILVQNDKYGSKILECDPPKEVSGNNQSISGGGNQVISMQAQKMNRLQNRHEYAVKNSLNRK